MFPLSFAFFLGGSFVLGLPFCSLYPPPLLLFFGCFDLIMVGRIFIIILPLSIIGMVFFAWGISPGQQKWWPTLLGSEISCFQWKAQACTEGALLFFLLSFGGLGAEAGGRKIKFFFPWFPMCSHYVHSKFPMGSPICSP